MSLVVSLSVDEEPLDSPSPLPLAGPLKLLSFVDEGLESLVVLSLPFSEELVEDSSLFSSLSGFGRKLLSLVEEGLESLVVFSLPFSEELVDDSSSLLSSCRALG